MMNLKRGLGMGLALAALAAVPAGANFSKSKSPKNSGEESVEKPPEPVLKSTEPEEHPTRNGRKPVDITLHFINAAARHKLHSKEITMKQAMKEVPIYAGLDNRTYRQLKQNLKYANKVRSPEWLAKAAEIKGVAHV